mmetsp:Transcript_14031/g.39713  ORF Transcript_14031/g.39713 Transcript_14031/m.39713 type:complete len:215 (+) Transcript_14031:71-715(+)
MVYSVSLIGTRSSAFRMPSSDISSRNSAIWCSPFMFTFCRPPISSSFSACNSFCLASSIMSSFSASLSMQATARTCTPAGHQDWGAWRLQCLTRTDWQSQRGPRQPDLAKLLFYRKFGVHGRRGLLAMNGNNAHGHSLGATFSHRDDDRLPCLKGLLLAILSPEVPLKLVEALLQADALHRHRGVRIIQPDLVALPLLEYKVPRHHLVLLGEPA